jgi:type II secretory pathway component GspD/PulD (secretin)
MRRRALKLSLCAAVCWMLGALTSLSSAQQPSSSLSVVGQPASSTGVTSTRPPAPQPVPVLPIPENGSNASITEAAKALLKAAGVGGQAPAESVPSHARGNPFAQQVAPPSASAEAVPASPNAAPTAPLNGAAGSNLVIPANPLDPEKAVVKDDNGLISLMVREGSLRQVIAMVAETQKLNIVFAGPTDTLVTASFDKQPWQTVLDSLLAASGHTWAMRDDIIFVSSVENADFLPPGAEGRRVEVFELDFASALDLDQTIKGLLSPAGQSWIAESVKTDNRRTREAVAVMDYPANLARVSDYICQADQPPRQVYIEAHILQVELKDDCKSGVNFQELMSLASGRVRLSTAGFASKPVSDSMTGPNTGATPSFFVETDGVGLDGVIELLKATTDAKSLADPKIHAVSGQESNIQIGEKLGYHVTTTTQTSTMESVQFLDVGVVLTVTPRITRDGRVLMRIRPKVSTGSVTDGLPNEKTTEVETDVLVSSGQGIVIGGLIQEVDNNVSNKVPLLGEIPYVGILFQRRQVTRTRQEIIVTLQPHVLPYEPILQARLDHEFMRTTQPLTQGALHSAPRPYEPAMYDVLNPKEHKLTELPPVDWPGDMGPMGEPLELPSIEVLDPAAPPIPEEAIRSFEESESLPPPSDVSVPSRRPVNPFIKKGTGP